MIGFGGMGMMTASEKAMLDADMQRIYNPANAFLLSGFGDDGGYPEPSPMPSSSPGAGMVWKWNEGAQYWDTVPIVPTISYQAPISLDPGYAVPYAVRNDSKKAYIFAGALVAAAIAYLALVK